MPEIPDVEVARRKLDRWIGGASIVAAHSKDRHVMRPKAPSALARALVGRSVREVARRGKWIRIALEDGGRLFSHLGMTGDWVRRDAGAPAERFERARIDVARGGDSSSVRYVDSRRFGRLIVAKDDIPEWSTLGPDPLVDGIDPKALGAALHRSRRSVKEVLMDQSVLAGIGNILATEGLWHARIDPRSRSSALSSRDVTAVVRGLDKAIREELAPREAAGEGEWVDVFAVYGHTGEPCPRDGTRLVRTVQGGRTTTFCKHCQLRRR
jgi:formamidopyrimidine-DNA glycosylase